jgi:hypothetical protein
MQTNYAASKRIRQNLRVYIVLLLMAMLLFLPVINKNFASDDFVVLNRIVFNKIFFIRGFFRPLSDLSLYGSYLMGGFNPAYYNVTNIVIHAACAFILYRFCTISTLVPPANQRFFSILATLLFLVYPFHNEAIIWAVGRGIVLSAFFGFLSLLIVFTTLGSTQKYILSCLFYFIGLCGYEAIVPLPVLILLLLWCAKKEMVKWWIPAGAYLLTFTLNMLIRWWVAGTIWGSYGNKVFVMPPSERILQMVKTTGRLFLPPAQSSQWLAIAFCVLVTGLVVVGRSVIRKAGNEAANFKALSLATLFSLFMPVVFGISSRTYEGDRVFYFSSFFLCAWLAWLLSAIPQKKWRIAVSIVTTGYFLFFFYQSVFTWRKAGTMSGNIVNTVRNAAGQGRRVFLINIPEEYNGAQVMRNGFKEALLVNGIDTAGVVPVNYLSTEYAVKRNEKLLPELKVNGIFIYPAAFVSAAAITARMKMGKKNTDTVLVPIQRNDKILYWNKEAFVALP